MPGWKPRDENIDKLEWFLDNNNCLIEKDYKGCYLQTRLLLIATTKELDSSNALINALNETIDKLTGNINFIIDEFKKTGETK